MTEPSPHFKRALMWLFLAILFFAFIYAIRSILLPFVVGMLMAYLLDPAADRLERAGLKRGASAGIITLICFSAFVLACVLVAPVIAHQASELLTAAPEYLVQFKAQYSAWYHKFVNVWLARIDPEQADAVRQAADNVAVSAVSATGSLATQLFQSGMALINLASLLLITPLVAFYLLRDWDMLMVKIDNLLPRRHEPVIREQIQHIDDTLAGFLRGQLNVCFILAIYYALALTIVGLPYSVLIGIASGLLIILPYVGFLVSCMVAIGVAIAAFGFTLQFWLVIAVYAVAQLIESYYLTPNLVGSRVGLHPLWIVFGMLAGAALFGFVGILLAVPITAVIGVLIRFAVDRYLASGLYSG